MKNFSLKIFWFWPKNSSYKYVFYQKINLCNARAPKFGARETPFFWFLMGYRTYSMSHALQDETVEKFFEVLRNFQIVPGRLPLQNQKIKLFKISFLRWEIEIFLISLHQVRFWSENIFSHFQTEKSKWDYFFSVSKLEFELRIFFLTSEVRFWSENIFSHFRSEIFKKYSHFDFFEVRFLNSHLNERLLAHPCLNLMHICESLVVL